MRDAPAFVIAIGPLPPPLGGFSLMTARMIEMIKRNHETAVANVSPRPGTHGLVYHLIRAMRVASAGGTLLRHSFRRGKVAYIACEGDGGLVYTAFLARLARALGYPTFLHHHSFGYIDQPRGLMRMVIDAGGRQLTHIFLCEGMGQAFRRAYPKPLDYKIVSNAAFVPPHPNESARHQDGTGLTIGLLSNLNRPKGLHTFLELLTACKAKGLPVRGVLAGPIVNRSDEPAVEAAQEALGSTLTYMGPVTGEAKDAFFAAIDVFVFPTTYPNEAQPTVLYEALSAGNLIISHDRGCIAGQVQGHGLVIPREGNFIAFALPYLEHLLADFVGTQQKRRIARTGFLQLHAEMQDAVRTLFVNPSG